MSVVIKSTNKYNPQLINGEILSAYSSTKIGRVQAIIMDENTPSPEVFKNFGGWDGVGTIFYSEYTPSSTLKEITLDKDIINSNIIYNQIWKPAKPISSNICNYPLLGELVFLTSAPNAKSPLSPNNTSDYYSLLNIWNNGLVNSIFDNQDPIYGKYFTINNLIKTTDLKAFEGDYIINGRFNNSIRLGSSSKAKNFWSNGVNNDPITIISNGRNPKPPELYVEDVNNDDSTMLLTTSQTIPLNVSITTLNPFTNTILPKNYSNGSQIILNSDRLVFNSKKDDILISSTTNTEIYSKGDITLNSESDVIINSKNIILGIQSNSNQYPTQPAVLGTALEDVLSDLIGFLASLGNELTSAVSTDPGTPLVSVNTAGANLTNNVLNLINKLESIKSNSVFIKDNIN